MAVAGAVLQWNPPLPARAMCGRLGVWSEIVRTAARHGQRTVARQPVRPVVIAGLHRLFDQQSAKARTIDEEIGLDPLAAFQSDGFDKAVIEPQRDIDDLALGPHHAALFGIVDRTSTRMNSSH